MAEADARFPAPSKRTASAGPAGLDVHSMIGFVRVGAPVASPTGDKVAWAARRWCADRKKWGSSICLFDLAAWEAAGAEPNRAPDFTVQLTRIAPGVSDSSPVFSPDGVSLAFSSNRSGSSQVWVLPTLNGPGEAVQLTDFPLDVSDVRWGAGDRLFFACAVFPSLTIEATAAKDKELEELKKTGGVNAMSFTSLPVRHWDSWCDAKRNHIFMAAIEREDGAWRVGAPTDLLAGLATDCPLKPFGGSEDYSVSPDGTSVVYCCRPPADQANDQAWSTNSNLYLHLLCGDAPNPLDTPRRRSGPSSPTACSDDEDLEDVPSSPAFKASPGGAANVHQVSGRLPHHVAGCLTMGNDGYDLHPVYSPCGQQIAYLSMATAGYEADTQKIKVFDLRTGSRREIASGWDASVEEICWSPDGKKLFCTAQYRGRKQVYSVDLDNASAGTKAEPSTLVAEHASGGLSLIAGRRLVFSQSSLCAPAEVFTCLADGSALCALSSANASQLNDVRMGTVSEMVCNGAKNEPVQSWLVCPAGFDSKLVYPMVVIVHGGPQGAILDSFGYRWNPQIYAGAGFVVLCVNFHGSTGFGSDFCRSISKDWAGAPYDDIISATDHACDTLPFVDRTRVAALGASFGGYMINLINGRNGRAELDESRYKCLVNHDGIFDCASTYYSTEELFFPEFEFGGPPFKSPGIARRYAECSPSSLVADWTTPTLVIHGGKDFRLGEAEGLSTFTALQRQGIPSELLYFPTENHWVLSPPNSIVWHDKVLAWLARWLKPAKENEPQREGASDRHTGADSSLTLQLTPTK